MHFNILTLFPDMFPGFLGQSIAGTALGDGRWSYSAIQMRDFATDKHKTVDDTPYGGGAGMVIKPDVVESALLSIPQDTRGQLLYMSPRGERLTHALAMELATAQNLTILCGRYEGVDQRVLDAHQFREVSIGDYILSGGEPAALIVMDAIIRLLPGVMGNDGTLDEESFSDALDGMLEYPHFTRPATWVDANGIERPIPDVLTSGNHARIKDWRREQSAALTKKRNP